MKIEPAGFADKLDMGCERKGGVKYECKVFDLSSWKDEVDVALDPETVRPVGGHVG